jgi:RNA polymerase sigma-54 factor
MKHSLQLRLSQHLTLTPQLQQSIRLLQLSTLELNQEIEKALQDNPLLEREDDGGAEMVPLVPPRESPGEADEAPREAAPEPAEDSRLDSTDTDRFEPDFGPGGSREDSDESDYPQVAADSPSLREHLLGQLGTTALPERDRRLVALLIDSLDDGGYLEQDLAEIAALVPEELGVEPEELSIALAHLQHLDPPGVGARNLGECLALQLEALPPETPHRAAALVIVREHLDLLAQRDFQKLKRHLHCGDDELRGVKDLITHLDPRPGSQFGVADTRYVVPDVVVRKVKGVWVASLNQDAMPKLRINRLYADILSRNREAGHQQLSSQLQEAKWLIKNVQQRFDTILRVSQAIVDRQRRFFEHGEVAMRPLVLREIADTLDLHESTVSRVTTQKFMLTPRGIFELKYFFGSHVATDSGGEASSTAIRALIKQLVGAENSKKPLSDSQISEVLGQQGIVVARRTVAKYRESMQILPVNLRKSI